MSERHPTLEEMAEAARREQAACHQSFSKSHPQMVPPFHVELHPAHPDSASKEEWFADAGNRETCDCAYVVGADGVQIATLYVDGSKAAAQMIVDALNGHENQVGREALKFTITTPERRCLELLARGEITASKAAEWMRAYINEGRIDPLPDDGECGRPIPPHRSGGGFYTGPKCPHGRAEGWCDDCVPVAGDKS